jgi:hypothetical protein
MSHTHDIITKAADAVQPVSSHLDIEDKGEIAVLEHKLVEHEDPNSPEAILDRYPLLRVMSEGERETLNRRVRRRMCVQTTMTLGFVLTT